MAHKTGTDIRLRLNQSKRAGRDRPEWDRIMGLPQPSNDVLWDKPALRGLDLERRVSDEPAAREAAPGCFQEYLPFSRAIFLLY